MGIIQNSPRAASPPPQFSLRALFVLTLVVAATTALTLWSETSLPIIVPFCMALSLTCYYVRRPELVGWVFCGLHAVTALGILAWTFQTRDGTGRWMRALGLLYINLPLTVLTELVGEPSNLFLATILFLVASLMWFGIGWALAKLCDQPTRRRRVLCSALPSLGSLPVVLLFLGELTAELWDFVLRVFVFLFSW